MMELIIMFFLFLLWALVGFINISLASNKCTEASNKNNNWYLWAVPISVTQIFDYYSPFSPSNLFGFRSLFVPFKIPYSK